MCGSVVSVEVCGGVICVGVCAMEVWYCGRCGMWMCDSLVNTLVVLFPVSHT